MNIKVLLMDIDGVLTDGSVYVDSAGNETKRLSFDDIDAVFALKEAGIKVGFITGEDNGFAEYVKRRFSPDYFASGCKDKLAFFRKLEEAQNMDRGSVCYVGDSAKDAALLEYLDISFAPSDADGEAKKAAKRVLRAARGNGAVMEVARLVLGGEGIGLNPLAPGACEARDVRAVAIIAAFDVPGEIPHKNTMLLMGRPLVSYAVRACLETPGVCRVAVCTNSADVAEAARQSGNVEVVGKSAALCGHPAPDEILRHSIERLEGAGSEFNALLFVRAEYALTEPSDLAGLLEKVREGHDSAALYTEDFGNFSGWDGPWAHPSCRLRETRKREAGNAMAFWRGCLTERGQKRLERPGLFRLERPRELSVDTECDLYIAERMLQLRERKRRGLYWQRREVCTGGGERDFEAAYWSEVVDPDGNRRNRLLERAQRIEDIREEIAYINSLRPGRILDVGCGMGDLLSAVAEGWEKHGLEVSEFAAREASMFGHIFVGQLKDAPYEREYFDLVVMNHVIEHMESPDEEIERVRAMLKHRGKLIIGTPDFDGAMARRYGERYRLLHDRTHVSLFSRVSLRHFIEDHGFEVERESFPFFETRHFTAENLLRLLDTNGVSPPFWGSFMTFYCVKKW